MANDETASAVDQGRRNLLNWFLSTTAGAFLVSVTYPLSRYLIPPDVEESTAHTVTLALKPQEVKPNSGQIFRFGSQAGILVKDANGELKAYILKITDQWFALTSVQIAVAVLVAILGIVNTLTVSITDRRRELGVLRAVGGLAGQIRRTIWMEAIAIGVLGLILGFAFGALNLYYILEVVRRDIAGLRLDYSLPMQTIAMMVPVILAAAFVAAIWPAESAVHGSLVEALEYE
jgi:ABC-type antimicrobial peptide transport system permease subunit